MEGEGLFVLPKTAYSGASFSRCSGGNRQEGSGHEVRSAWGKAGSKPESHGPIRISTAEICGLKIWNDTE